MWPALCIDIGQHAGWALGDAESEQSGVWELALAGHARWQRLDLFGRHLTTVLRRAKPRLVVVERPFLSVRREMIGPDGEKSVSGHTDMDSHRQLLGYLALAELIAQRLKRDEELEIEVREVNTWDAKRALYGWFRRKNPETKKWETVTKQMVRAAVNARRQPRGLPAVTDLNESDALSMLYLLRAEAKGSGPPVAAPPQAPAPAGRTKRVPGKPWPAARGRRRA